MALNNEYTDYVNSIVGSKIHELRICKGLSRQQLGRMIDVTQQQVEKYEKGTNRISAGRLAATAQALNKPIGDFFDETECEPTEPLTRMAMEVSRNFIKIKSKNAQNAISDMVRTLSKE